MIIQFVEDEGLPTVVSPLAHAVIQKEDLGE